MNNRQDNLASFNRLLDIMEELREKCPWDKVQTNESLRANTIEETYELSEAILNNDPKEIKKELGDLLLHIIFYAKIGEEKKSFDIGDVCNAISDKLVFRHPHVFGDTTLETAALVEKSWEQIKMKEKDGNKTILDERRDVWDKVSEEMTEVKAEIDVMDQDRMEAEFGDLLFSIVNAARLYNVNPDNALERTNRKFIKRFNYLEREAKQNGRNLKDMTLAEMEEIWQESKKEDVE